MEGFELTRIRTRLSLRSTSVMESLLDRDMIGKVFRVMQIFRGDVKILYQLRGFHEKRTARVDGGASNLPLHSIIFGCRNQSPHIAHAQQNLCHAKTTGTTFTVNGYFSKCKS